MRRSLAVLGLALAMYAQQSGKRDAGGVPVPTVRLERGRTVYVLSSCHFCHGIDLTGAAMGSADLLHVASAGRDEGGNYIGVIVRNGLPNLQTAMPQYSDYTAEQISDLAAYVHYLRRLGRYRELTSLPSPDSGTRKLARTTSTAIVLRATRSRLLHVTPGNWPREFCGRDRKAGSATKRRPRAPRLI